MASKHQHYIDMIVKNNNNIYEFMAKNVLYHDLFSNKCGEIDVLGKMGKTLDIYEVKCNDRYYKKAVEQLRRAKGVLAAPGLEIRLYYYVGSRDQLRRID